MRASALEYFGDHLRTFSSFSMETKESVSAVSYTHWYRGERFNFSKTLKTSFIGVAGKGSRVDPESAWVIRALRSAATEWNCLAPMLKAELYFFSLGLQAKAYMAETKSSTSSS